MNKEELRNLLESVNIAADLSVNEAIEYIEDYKDESKKIHEVLVELPNL